MKSLPASRVLSLAFGPALLVAWPQPALADGGAGSCAAVASTEPAVSVAGSGVPRVVVAPPGWYSGDTHVHSQPCGGPAPPDIPIEDLFAEQVAADLDVVWLLYWGIDGVQKYADDYAALVDGEEHPVSAGDPDHFLQEAVEVSQFDASQFGHQIGIAIDDGFFPNVKYPAPIFDHFLSQPGAVTGYAHVRWHGDYEPVDPAQNFHIGTSMGPVDAAMGRIDFLEASFFDPLDELDFRGMYYKLLNSGFRLGLSGGTDNTCLYPDVGAMRNWVRLEDGEPLSPAAWAAALAGGRSTVSLGGSVFLDVRVEDAGIGEELALAAAGTVRAELTAQVAPGAPVDGDLILIRDGQEIFAEPLSLSPEGSAVVSVEVPVTRSSWFAGSVDGHAHTGAVWVTVAGRPIARAADASYWIAMLEGLSANLGPPFDTAGAEAAIQAEIASAVEVFEATQVLAAGGHPGITPYGVSTPACDGPQAIGATVPPKAGAGDFALTSLHAPPDTAGLLALGLAPLDPGLPIEGAELLVGTFFEFLPAATHGGGFAQVPLPLPPLAAGIEFYAQFLWINPPGCGEAPVSATNAIAVVVQ